MGASWRIGIDSANATELVSKGLFSVSRNPIFLAIRLALLGFFLVAPNAATLAILAAAEWAVAGLVDTDLSFSSFLEL
jgi:protein-S-isoprenylcysteine O-methyltransferase Ste14